MAKMNPDKLNSKIAEKIMGYYVHRFKSEYDNYSKDCEVWITNPKRKNEPSTLRDDVTILPRPYSTEVSTAFEIVNKLFSDDWKISIEGSEVLAPYLGGYTVKFECKAGARGRHTAEARTLPTAICLAALKAVKSYE